MFVVWIVLDPKLEEYNKRKSIKLIHIEEILGIELNDDWFKKRYFKVKLLI